MDYHDKVSSYSGKLNSTEYSVTIKFVFQKALINFKF